MTDDRLQGRTRWSMAARCPRMAAMGLLGFEPSEPSERELGRMQRGKDAQRYHARRLIAKYGESGVVLEKAVPWPKPPELPIGELHTDFVILEERLAMEVKSSEAVDSMFDMSLMQLKGQIYFDDDVDAGALTFLDRDYQVTDMFPVIVTDEDVAELNKIVEQVVGAGKTGKLPERTCERPGDGIGKLCPFISDCFADWEPPMDQDGTEIAGKVTAYYLAKQAVDAKQAELDPLEEKLAEAKDDLLAAEPAVGTTPCGPLLLNRTDVADRQSFSLAKARKSGLWTGAQDELFHAFISTGGAHTRFTVKRTSEEPLIHEDPGDEAPF
jgi:hypothetical protein